MPTYRKETEVVDRYFCHSHLEGIGDVTFEGLLPPEATKPLSEVSCDGPRGRFRIVVEFEPDEG